jgi:Replication-relaxation
MAVLPNIRRFRQKRAQVSDLTIQHELEVMDVKAAFHSTIHKTENFAVTEFSTWPLLHQFDSVHLNRGADVLVKPDGFVRVHEHDADGGVFEHSFFLELDRSSQTQDTLATRAGAYLEHYRSGGFAIKNGATRDAYKEYPFRVLFVFKNAERRNNMAERLLQSMPPILTLVYLSTFAEVKADPLGPIWIRPLDYREVTKATSFDSEGWHEKFGYKRQSAREIFVEQKIRKSKLLV